jgi:hypothetical protein
MISRSPQRNSFQKESYIKNCKESGDEPNPEHIKMYDDWNITAKEREADPKWQKDNLEYDLRITDWILEKVRTKDSYAQNLYAALCNNEFTKRDLWPVLKDQKWSCSWRYAGGIIADMQEKGDYIDWYCSGIRNNDPIDDSWYTNATVEMLEYLAQTREFVGEGHVTEEIENDLHKLGWIVVKYDSTKDI